MLLAAALSPAPASGADLFLHSRSAADLDEIITPAYDTVPRRRVVQSFDAVLANLWATEEREVLRLSFSGDIATDFGRDVVRSSPDPRVNEPVDLLLRRLELEAWPVNGLAVRGGRLALYGPLTPTDLDGAWVEATLPLGLLAGVGGGREPRRDLARLDGDLWDPPGGRFDAFDEPVDTTWLAQAELGWTGGPARLRAGHRTRWRHGDRVGQSSALALELALEPVGVRALADWNHLIEGPDRLDLQVRGAFAGDRASAWLGWRLERPSFDGDSLFNIFALTPWVGWRAGGEWRPAPVLAFSAEGWLRAFGLAEDPPWSGGLSADGERAGGGALRASWTPLAPLSLRASASADGGRGGTLVSEELAARYALLPGLAELGLRLRHAWRQSDDFAARYGHLLAIRGQARYDLTSFGRVSAVVDGVSDYRFGRSIRVMVMAEFDLGPI